MAKKKKSLPKITLNEIPDHVVLLILRKMPSVELIRMRTTSSRINKFVEEDKETFSKNVDTGIHVTLETQYHNGNELLTYYCNNHKKRRQIVLPDSRFEDRFSAVSIKYISVRSFGHEQDNEGIIASFLRRLQPSCIELSFYCHYPLNYLVQIADLVESRTANFETANLRHEANPISTLLQGERKSTFFVALEDTPTILHHLEGLVHFKEIACYSDFTMGEIYSLVMGLKHLTDFGTLQEISLAFPEEDPFKNPNFPFPATKRLWNIYYIPEQFERNRRPAYIRKLELDGDKCAIIIKPWKYNEVRIKFVKNTSEDVLQVIFDSLSIEDSDFEPNQKKEFVEASEDDQIRIIREFYLKNCAVRRWKRGGCFR